MRNPRPRGVTVVALLMILFGAAEVVTSLKHSFFGIVTSSSMAATYSSLAIGALYAASGALVLTKKKWAATLAITFLALDFVGRVTLAITGLFPTKSFEQTFAFFTGTAIVAVFAVYVALNWATFS